MSLCNGAVLKLKRESQQLQATIQKLLRHFGRQTKETKRTVSQTNKNYYLKVVVDMYFCICLRDKNKGTDPAVMNFKVVYIVTPKIGYNFY